MGISVAIATHNRSTELGLTLMSVQRAFSGKDQYEVLVVDNASTDRTSQVVKEFVPQFSGKLRYILEPQLGLSHARNRAIAEANFDVIGFLDDDVDLEPHWLETMRGVFGTTECAAVGGRAFLTYPVPRPRWLDEAGEGLLTKVDLGKDRRVAGADEIFGLNLCIRRDWIARVGPFRTDLGRIGKCLLSSEEEELMSRIVAAGGLLLYEPRAVVAHRVDPNRLNRRWFLSRIYWGQRGQARMVPDSEVSGYHFLRSSWHVALGARDWLRTAVRRGPGSPAMFDRSMQMAGRVGFWIGFARRLWLRLWHSIARGVFTSRGRIRDIPPGPLPCRSDQAGPSTVATRG